MLGFARSLSSRLILFSGSPVDWTTGRTNPRPFHQTRFTRGQDTFDLDAAFIWDPDLGLGLKDVIV